MAARKPLSVIVISITPFDAQERLDETAFRLHLRRLREAGVSVYVAGGGSGEAFTFTPEERDRVLAIAVEELKGKVPVRAMGCEPRVVGEMVQFLRAAERAKVDAAHIFQLEIGHSAKPTYAELDRYYSTAIESTSLPVILSSHRASGYFIPIDLVENLVGRYPNLRGIAYGGFDITYLAELIARVGDRIEVRCAGPSLALSVLGLGGNGFMGGEGNFCPRLAQSVITAWESQDYELLRTSWGKLMRFAAIHNQYGSGTMRAMKPLLNAFGLPGGTMRLPRVTITPEQREDVVKAVTALDIPETPSRPLEAR